MSDSPDSWVVYGPKRSPRAKLLGSVLAIIQAKDRQIRARLHQISGSGGVLQITDALDEAAKAGASCVVQTGGSVRDDEVIAAANEHGMAMVFTGVRHFRH